MEQQDVSSNGSIDFIDQFVEGLNSDHLIELLRGAPPHTSSAAIDAVFHNPQLLTVSLDNDVDYSIGGFGPTPEDLFELGLGRSMVFDDPSSILNSLSGLEDNRKAGNDEDDEDEDGDDDDDETDHSSVTATTPTSGSKKSKLDRTRTLISERKRRGRMKDKLYALRALVPNITKMDKASIVGDAVLYVQDLQMQAKKLKVEITELESSMKDGNIGRGFVQDSKNNPIARVLVPAPKIITQIDVFQVEEREFYVRLRSNKGQGVAVSLYKALESLSNAIVRNSNLTTVSERFILAFTLTVGGECQEDANLPSLKMWITRAFINQGFSFGTT
ncbi:hypothetical protein V2J09_011496 [Rumex salicifolius]